jgi:lipid A 3-O-deacylase
VAPSVNTLALHCSCCGDTLNARVGEAVLRNFIVRTLFVLACAWAPGLANAQSVPGIEIQADNDGLNLWLSKVSRTDGEYTNGLRVSLSRGIAPLWGRLVRSTSPCLGTEAVSRHCLTTEFAVAQQIYTPLNAENEPRPIDRPFVGWLHADITANVISTSRLRSFKLTAGFTGPPTLARNVQQAFHRAVGVTNGDGWNYQLGFSPAGSLTYTERLRSVLVSTGHRAVVDLLSTWSAQAGNSRTDAYGEIVARAGVHIPHPWNPTSRMRRSATTFGIWVYGGFRETGVAYDQTLDRSWSRGGLSYSVERSPWVSRSEFGIGVRHRSLMMTFGGNRDGREYRTEYAPHSYGSLTMTIDQTLVH